MGRHGGDYERVTSTGAKLPVDDYRRLGAGPGGGNVVADGGRRGGSGPNGTGRDACLTTTASFAIQHQESAGLDTPHRLASTGAAAGQGHSPEKMAGPGRLSDAAQGSGRDRLGTKLPSTRSPSRSTKSSTDLGLHGRVRKFLGARTGRRPQDRHARAVRDHDRAGLSPGYKDRRPNARARRPRHRSDIQSLWRRVRNPDRGAAHPSHRHRGTGTTEKTWSRTVNRGRSNGINRGAVIVHICFGSFRAAALFWPSGTTGGFSRPGSTPNVQRVSLELGGATRGGDRWSAKVGQGTAFLSAGLIGT